MYISVSTLTSSSSSALDVLEALSSSVAREGPEEGDSYPFATCSFYLWLDSL